MKIVIVLFLLFGCDSTTKSPQGTIQGFFDTVFSKEVSKNTIDKYTTGSLNSFFSDEKIEELKQISITGKHKIRTIHESCDSSSCTITFELINQTDNSSKESVKKIATLSVDQKQNWKISSLQNIKTSFNFKDIEIPSAN